MIGGTCEREIGNVCLIGMIFPVLICLFHVPWPVIRVAARLRLGANGRNVTFKSAIVTLRISMGTYVAALMGFLAASNASALFL